MLIIFFFCFDLVYLTLSQNQCKSFILSEIDQNKLLNMHNYFRSQVAMGIVENQPSARNINILSWDQELANKAQQCAEQCSMISCHLQYGHIIEHVNLKKGVEQSTSEIVKHWFNKHAEFNPQYVKHYQPGKSPSQYTQLVWAESYLIGCGRSLIQEQTRDTQFLICYYYPPGNVADQFVYQIGQPGQGCVSKEIHHPGLCVPQLNKTQFKFKDFSFIKESTETNKYFQYNQIKKEIQQADQEEEELQEEELQQKNQILKQFLSDEYKLSYQQMNQK